MKLFWTQEARTRLVEIQAYIAQDSPAAARDVAARLLRRSRQLTMPPLPGRRLPEYPEAEDLREVLVRPFRIIFQVAPDRIDVLTIKHYRQNLPRRPERIGR